MRRCGWCEGEIPARARRDSIYCRKACRQAAHRAKVSAADIAAEGEPMRLAYADPPYPGLARRYYGDQPDYAGEVDHEALLARLQGYDGWALSTSAASLPRILAMAAALGMQPRIGIWVRGARPHQLAAIWSAWEPLLYSPARSRNRTGTVQGTEDVLITQRPRRRTTLPGNVIGMKPPAYAEWAFRLMGAAPGDALDDLFPGSGIVSRTWSLYSAQPSRPPAGDVSAIAARQLERPIEPWELQLLEKVTRGGPFVIRTSRRG